MTYGWTSRDGATTFIWETVRAIATQRSTVCENPLHNLPTPLRQTRLHRLDMGKSLDSGVGQATGKHAGWANLSYETGADRITEDSVAKFSQCVPAK